MLPRLVVAELNSIHGPLYFYEMRNIVFARLFLHFLTITNKGYTKLFLPKSVYTTLPHELPSYWKIVLIESANLYF